MPYDTASLDTECFFIAPIGKEGAPERNRSDGILEFIVGRAAQELGLTAVRGDQISEPGQITLQVIDHVLGAKAAVADLTYLNPNVFYELAVRHTARLPTALIAEKGCDLPFDIAQMRTIFFDHTDLRSADSCRIAIVAQLSEALDKGTVDSPIATSIDVRALQGGNEAERNIAELVTAIEDVAKVQRQTLQQVNRIRADASRRSRLPQKSIEHIEDAINNLRRAFTMLDALASMQENNELRRITQDLKITTQDIASEWGAIRDQDIAQERLWADQVTSSDLPPEYSSSPDNKFSSNIKFSPE